MICWYASSIMFNPTGSNKPNRIRLLTEGFSSQEFDLCFLCCSYTSPSICPLTQKCQRHVTCEVYLNIVLLHEFSVRLVGVKSLPPVADTDKHVHVLWLRWLVVIFMSMCFVRKKINKEKLSIYKWRNRIDNIYVGMCGYSGVVWSHFIRYTCIVSSVFFCDIVQLFKRCSSHLHIWREHFSI